MWFLINSVGPSHALQARSWYQHIILLKVTVNLSLHTPWGIQVNKPHIFKIWHQLEVNGGLYTPTDLPGEKHLLSLLNWRLFGPQICCDSLEKKILSPCLESDHISSLVQLVPGSIYRLIYRGLHLSLQCSSFVEGDTEVFKLCLLLILFFILLNVNDRIF